MLAGFFMSKFILSKYASGDCKFRALAEILHTVDTATPMIEVSLNSITVQIAWHQCLESRSVDAIHSVIVTVIVIPFTLISDDSVRV